MKLPEDSLPTFSSDSYSRIVCFCLILHIFSDFWRCNSESILFFASSDKSSEFSFSNIELYFLSLIALRLYLPSMYYFVNFVSSYPFIIFLLIKVSNGISLNILKSFHYFHINFIKFNIFFNYKYIYYEYVIKRY